MLIKLTLNWRLACLGCLGMLAGGLASGTDDTDLAKQSQNPIGNMVSVPFQNTTYFDMGPSDLIAVHSLTPGR